MRAAIVKEAGKPPIYGHFKDPVPVAGEVCVNVSAAALSPIVKGRASGAHYSPSGSLPFVVGIDGVGRLDDGRRVYFVLPQAPFGSMSEQTVVPLTQCISLPDGLDDVTTAAIANPGMSAWAAFKERAKLVAGEVVLVNGATGTAGRLAVQIAKYVGAKKVIATGRNMEALVAVGADVTIPIGEADEEFERALRDEFASDGINVVLDYLWGASAERVIIAAAKAGREALPVRFVQVGSVSGSNITLPSAALRSSALELMGSGIGSVSVERLVTCVEELMLAAGPAGFAIDTRVVPLSEVESVWGESGSGARVVFQIS